MEHRARFGWQDAGGLFLLVCRAFIAGVDGARRAAFETVVAAVAHGPRIVVTTTEELAAELREQEDRS